MSSKRVFTSESVSEGHPDKMADQISDAILAQDLDARVACETLVKTGLVMLAGEITTSAQIEFEEITRGTINKIGYDHSAVGFDGHNCATKFL